MTRRRDRIVARRIHINETFGRDGLCVFIDSFKAHGAAIKWDAPEDNPLAYAGFGPGRPPRSAEELWKNENYRLQKAARVGAATVQRTRPIFKSWEFEATGVLDTEILDFEDLVAVAKIAGQLIGLGDWRPEKGGSYGRFTAAVTDLGEYVVA